jgi:hypothetical protein
MAQKQQRGNREAKKPKQNKTKAVSSVSPFTAAAANKTGRDAPKRK